MLSYKCDLFDRPGLSWSPAEIRSMVVSLRSLASTCFSPLPDYQCLSLSNPHCLDDKVVVVARRLDTNEIVAFTSSLYYDVPGIGKVFHTGLTCIHPSARRSGFLAILFSHIVPHVLKSYPKGIWMSNVSEVPCVLVSASEAASCVFPSLQESFPSATHLLIAEKLATSYRHLINMPPEATFDMSKFVFRVVRPPGSPFRTNPFDPDVQHRKKLENDYYRSMLNKEGGDDVLQVAFLDPHKMMKVIDERTSLIRSRLDHEIIFAKL
ncbi:hypothetical protein SCHPADRAFT_654528 [Schizopora paradoxa]|uniref:N-acetyltransferase domain-containing protein n=1 Tax=Schizopora paradoxa TaxID=27342 RepID=A0A0H2R694_9AGAM|nr:hypothetical protein SCHPADRAFT_654528 [Schizopora paradoxa]